MGANALAPTSITAFAFRRSARRPALCTARTASLRVAARARYRRGNQCAGSSAKLGKGCRFPAWRTAEVHYRGAVGPDHATNVTSTPDAAWPRLAPTAQVRKYPRQHLVWRSRRRSAKLDPLRKSRTAVFQQTVCPRRVHRAATIVFCPFGHGCREGPANPCR